MTDFQSSNSTMKETGNRNPDPKHSGTSDYTNAPLFPLNSLPMFLYLFLPKSILVKKKKIYQLIFNFYNVIKGLAEKCFLIF